MGLIRHGMGGAARGGYPIAAFVAATMLLGWSLAMVARAPLAACHRRAHASGNVWSAERKQRLARAFGNSGLPFQAAAWRTVEQMLDGYVDALVRSYDDACDALHRDGIQSRDTFERRLACLEERHATIEKVCSLLDEGDRAVMTEAVNAVARLEPVDACASLTSLAQPQPLPASPTARDEIRAIRRAAAEARGLELVGRYGDAFKQASELSVRALALAFAPVEAEVALLLGNIERDRGRWSEAETAYVDSLDAAERGRADLVRADAMTEFVGVVGHLEGRVAEGHRWARLAESVLERLGQPQHERAQLLMRRGLLRLSEAKFDDAETDLREATRMREALAPPNAPLLAITTANLAAVLDTKGKYDEAERLYARAYAIMRDCFGEQHPRTLAVLVSLAGVSYSRGQFKKALAQYEAAIGPLTSALGATHPTVAATLANIANVDDYVGEHMRAVEYAERALASFTNSAPDSPLRGTVQLNLGVYLRALGRFERAHQLTDDCLARRRRLLGDSHPLVGEALYYKALIEIDEQRLADAQGHARAALALVERGYGGNHPRVADVLDALGIIDRAQGHVLVALDQHRQSLAIRERAGGGSETATTMTQVGLDLLALRRNAEARTILERALALRDASDGNPKTRAETEFALARALEAMASDARPRRLAEQALAAYAAGGPAFVYKAAEVRRWLQKHDRSIEAGGTQ
jgi:tetratricopeptide (TPR) repeat protein